jgi:hypothetical protein
MGLISASGTVSGVAQGTVQVNGDFANFCLHQRLAHLAKEVTFRLLASGTADKAMLADQSRRRSTRRRWRRPIRFRVELRY